jgi:hypothetical protein
MRMIDSIGYRFFWATEGLADGDYEFAPGCDCKTIAQLVGHLWGLSNWLHLSVLGQGIADVRPPEPDKLRAQILQGLYDVRVQIAKIGEEELFALRIDDHPLWHVINGPLADAMTHIGQIASFRRLNGNPVPKHPLFVLDGRQR